MQVCCWPAKGASVEAAVAVRLIAESRQGPLVWAAGLGTCKVYPPGGSTGSCLTGAAIASIQPGVLLDLTDRPLPAATSLRHVRGIEKSREIWDSLP